MAVTLLDAIGAARRRCTGDEWLLMSPREQTRIIYREMRRLDQEEATVAKISRVVETAPPERAEAANRREERAVHCHAPVRTRSSGQCAWKATVFLDGVPYCGFHARLEEAQRARVCATVDAD